MPSSPTSYWLKLSSSSPACLSLPASRISPSLSPASPPSPSLSPSLAAQQIPISSLLLIQQGRCRSYPLHSSGLHGRLLLHGLQI
ncbi:hypothetical protein PAHAL_9G445700 [Panicum hallii]|uniref:Uncharacterized protein n=1 Tax=Panicum hallii TaxID=206008 RepID=A0A2T8I4N0_9POAL|nr:hypothetical protein PAHAL_9G445700 [Panicum hallii]